MRRTVLLLTVTGFLQACATATSAPPVVQTCPTVPLLELHLPPAPDGSYTETMLKFLSGSLPKPTSYELPSSGVRLSTIP